MRLSEASIVHVAETLKGGVATYLNDLVRSQVDEWTTESVAVLIPRSQREYFFGAPSLYVIAYPDVNSRIFNSLICSIYLLLYCLGKKGIIHLHSSYAGFFPRIVAYMFAFNFKVAYCAHGWAWDRYASGMKRRAVICIEKLLSLFCHKVICISQYDYNSAIDLGFDRSKICLVSNALPDVVPLFPCEGAHRFGKKIKLLFVGRFDKQKGLDLLVEALNGLEERFDVTLVGDNVVDNIQELYIPSWFARRGWIAHDEVISEISNNDVLVVPSRWEGFGLVVLEAMRAGKAVVASTAGELPNLVSHGKTGLVFQNGNAVDLRETLLSLDSDDIHCFGAAAREVFLSKHTYNIFIENLLAVYKNMIFEWND